MGTPHKVKIKGEPPCYALDCPTNPCRTVPPRCFYEPAETIIETLQRLNPADAPDMLL